MLFPSSWRRGGAGSRGRTRSECSESLGSVDRVKGRTRYSASPAPETSSGNTVQTVDYLQREVSRLQKKLKKERENSRRLRIELDRTLCNRR